MSVEGNELVFRNIKLNQSIRSEDFGPGNENKLTVIFYSRINPPAFGEFLQNFQAPKPTYQTGNHVFPCVAMTNTGRLNMSLFVPSSRYCI